MIIAGIFVIIVGLKLETNDNLETIFLPIITSNSISNLYMVGVLDGGICNLCKYSTQYVMNVKIHINTAHEGFWNECYMCDHKATSNGRLITHKHKTFISLCISYTHKKHTIT